MTADRGSGQQQWAAASSSQRVAVEILHLPAFLASLMIHLRSAKGYLIRQEAAFCAAFHASFLAYPPSPLLPLLVVPISPSRFQEQQRQLDAMSSRMDHQQKLEEDLLQMDTLLRSLEQAQNSDRAQIARLTTAVQSAEAAGRSKSVHLQELCQQIEQARRGAIVNEEAMGRAEIRAGAAQDEVCALSTQYLGGTCKDHTRAEMYGRGEHRGGCRRVTEQGRVKSC